ncbi:MAG: class I SAM-dependent methyltransferase [Nitrospirota bacterium]
MTQNVVSAMDHMDVSDALRLELSTIESLVNYHSWIYQEIQPFLGVRLIEIGAGLGTFSDLLIRHHIAGQPNRTLELLEPTEGLFAQLRNKCQARHDGLLRTDRLRLANNMFTPRVNTFDTAIMINVLEHIEDDRNLISHIYSSIQPGGTLAVFSPALPFLYSPLDRRVGHFRRYRKNDLAALIEGAGFSLEKVQYMDTLGVIPWYVINVLAGSCSFNPLLAKTYDRAVVPITRWMEHCFGSPIGKNVLVVGRKALH